MSLVSGQSNKGVIQLARLRMPYVTNAITISIIRLFDVSLSMVTNGELVFARPVNQY